MSFAPTLPPSFVDGQKSATELMDGIVREFRAIVDPKTLSLMYTRDINYEPYSFFYIDLSKASGPTFYINFEVEMRKSGEEETDE